MSTIINTKIQNYPITRKLLFNLLYEQLKILGSKYSFVSCLSTSYICIYTKYLYINYIQETYNTLSIINTNLSSLLQVVIPIKIINNNHIYYKNIVLFTFPKLSTNNILILNGLKRIINNFFIKGTGIYIHTYYKLKLTITQIHIKLNDKDNIYIEINNKFEIFIIFNKFPKIKFLDIYFLTYKTFQSLFTNSNIQNYSIWKVLILNYIPSISFHKLSKLTTYTYIQLIINYLFNNPTIQNILLKLINLSIQIISGTLKPFTNILSNMTISSFASICNSYIILKLKYLETILFNSIYKKFFTLSIFISILIKQLSILKEYLLINPYIQYIEQTNSLVEIYNNIKIYKHLSYPNSEFSLNSYPISFRDIYLNHIAKICLIDTTEGIKGGLTTVSNQFTTLSTQSKILTNIYLPSSNYLHKTLIDPFLNISTIFNLQSNLTRKHYIFNLYMTYIYFKNIFTVYPVKSELPILTSDSIFNIFLLLIPFLNFNEPTRSLMGTKMLLQSVPLLYKETPYISTGLESTILLQSSNIIKTLQEGIIIYVSSYKIILRDLYNRTITYSLIPFIISNQGQCTIQRPIVWVGEKVSLGQILATPSDLSDSNISLGKNIFIHYGNFYGYEFEDSIIINKQLIYNNIFTSLAIDVYNINYKFTNTSIECLYNPYTNEECKTPILYTKIGETRILFPKISILFKHISNPTKIFLNQLFGDIYYNIEDQSIFLPANQTGILIKQISYFYLNFTNTNNIYLTTKIFIIKTQILQKGDKLCGRYGNKGIISNILNRCDMPFMNNLIPDLILSSLSIPSRLNIGQLIESLLGLYAFYTNKILLIPLFTTSFYTINILLVYIYYYLNCIRYLYSLNLFNPYLPGKVLMRLGTSGILLYNSTLIGKAFWCKLSHLVSNKLHYRSTGPYNQLTQQPLKGKSKLGGQKFGEMEIWALEAFGSSFLLKELLLLRSNKLLCSNLVLHNFTEKTFINLNNKLPYSFNILLTELKGLSIDINLLIVQSSLHSKFNYLSI